MRRWNWSLWLGLMLSVAAFVTYFAIFARYPVTRDIPWASFLLFAIALALLVAGVRRASRKIIPVIVAFIGAGILVLFTTIILVGTKVLPLSHGAPAIGQKAPDFTLPDTNRKPVVLSALLAAPGAKGVVLIFYRGYW